MIYSKSNLFELDLDYLVASNLVKDPSKILIIVPTRRKQRNYKKQIISERKNKNASKINIETFESTVIRVLQAGLYSYNILGRAAALVLLRQCINYKELSYFNSYKPEIPFGTLDKIFNVITEYKRHGIKPENMRGSSIDAPASDRNKIEDIALIFEKYQEKILSLNYKETGDLYADFINLQETELINNFYKLFENVSLIVISGFDEFSTLEIDVINKLSIIVNNNLFISLDYYPNDKVFAHLSACRTCFESNGFYNITDTSVKMNKDFIETIKNNFFTNRDFIPSNRYKDQITVIKSASRIREVEDIAKEVKYLIVNKGVEPHNICIVFNVINNYSNIVKDVFTHGNVPFNLTDRPYLSTSNIVISIINFLEILRSNYYYKNIQKALYGSFLRPKNFSIYNFIDCATELKIISGYSNWYSKLIDGIAKDTNGKKDDFAAALKDLEKLKLYLQPFEGEYTIAYFRQQLTNLIYEFNLPEKIVRLNEDIIAENAAALTSFIDTVNEVLELLSLEFGTEAKFRIDFFLKALTTALSGTRYNIKEKSNYGVLITTPNEIRDIKFDYLFIGGMCDNDLPTKYNNEVFYYREYADNKFKNHQIEERFHFYQTLRAWNYHLYLTYPLSDNSILTVSNFITEFLSLFDVTHFSDEDFRNILISDGDLYKNISNETIDISKLPIGFNKVEFNEKATTIEERANEQGKYAGVLTSDLTPELKDKLFKIREKEFSVTTIEEYAKCPFLYFVKNILKVKLKEEPTEESNNMEFGNIVHNILYIFYSRLDKLNIHLGGLIAEDFNTAYKLMFDTAEEILAENRFNLSFFQKEKILGINGNKKSSLLHKIIELENNEDNGFIPSFFEASFGWLKEEMNEYSIKGALQNGDIKLRGKIDRIDINKETKQFTVIDYKTGKIGQELKKAQTGEYFQLPVYIRAAQKIIKEKLNEDFTYAEAILFSLKYVEKEFKKQKINLTEEDVIKSFEFITEHIDNLASGKFNLAPPEKRENGSNSPCKYCSHFSICRKLELK